MPSSDFVLDCIIPCVAESSTNPERPNAVDCTRCRDLEHRYDDTVRHIREVLESRFQGLGEKVRELHRWQERRDEAIEGFYAHKRMHRIPIVNAGGRNIA